MGFGSVDVDAPPCEPVFKLTEVSLQSPGDKWETLGGIVQQGIIGEKGQLAGAMYRKISCVQEVKSWSEDRALRNTCFDGSARRERLVKRNLKGSGT